MVRRNNIGTLALAASLFAIGGALPAQAAGDLLVAPTRVILDGRRGTELVLNNVGSEPATYRISLELRRMTADGRLVDVEAPTEAEKAALEMIAYAPRRVTLQPNQPQAIRVGLRPPEGLAVGEYRVHMLFRAIPDAKSITAVAAPTKGIAFSLTPIYGVTIPVIVRNGKLEAKAAISNAKIVMDKGRQAVSFDVSRTGTRSLFGDVRVIKAGVGDPVVMARGIAVYPELTQRNVTLQVTKNFTGNLAGPATIQYYERAEEGGRMLAEAQVVLR
jgi:P pilus assembly chaperone PapD